MVDNCADDDAANDHQRDDANTQFGKQITPKMCIGKQKTANCRPKIGAKSTSHPTISTIFGFPEKPIFQSQSKQKKIKKSIENGMGVDNWIENFCLALISMGGNKKKSR